MNLDEFLEQLNEPELKQDAAFEAFCILCFREFFDRDDPAREVMAVLMADSFARQNWSTAYRVANKSARIRHPSKSMKSRVSAGPTLKM